MTRLLPNSFLTQLQIFQQEGYSPQRFLLWWYHHPLSFTISSKKPLVFTQKVKILTFTSILLYLSLNLYFLYNTSFYLTIFLLASFLFTPFIYLFFALLLMQPYEKINRLFTISRIRNQIQSQKNLTTICITGSFGKTSVKDFLYHLISPDQPTIKTPESYNTVFGIAKVIDLELLPRTQTLICEMGAYCRGEITELCHMVPPQYAILTAIGSQHLDRFKSLSNTTLAKFELIDLCPKDHCLANIDNPYIKKQLKLPPYQSVKTYSITDKNADYYVSKYTLSSSGISLTLTHQKHSYHFKSHLFGTSALQNLTAAISMSLMQQTSPTNIQKRLNTLLPSPHRLELKTIKQATLIDDAFSSNETGFTQLISDLKPLKGKKVLITPGIVELGSSTASIHQSIGKLANQVFDEVVLVGRSERTTNLEAGLKTSQTPIKISYIENSTNLWPLIDQLADEYHWILLENDLPDNY